MKKVYVSDETTMVLASLKNIDANHVLFHTFYEKEVPDNFHDHVYGDARVYGDAEVTNKAFNLIGLPYSITLTDNHIAIGCKMFDFETAKKLGKKDIKNLGIDNNQYQKMIEYKDFLLELIKTKEKINENDK